MISCFAIPLAVTAPSQPTPRALVSMSANTPSCITPSVTTCLNSPRLSRVRHRPSLTDFALFHTTTWSWSCGITRATVVVGERCSNHPGHVLLDDTVLPRSGVEDVALRIGEDVLDGPAVALVDDCLGPLVGQGPGNRHRLRGREREIEPGNGCCLLVLAGLLFGLDPGHFCCPFLVAEGGRKPGDSVLYPRCDARRLALRGRPQWLAADRIDDEPEHVLELLLAHLGANFDAVPAVEIGESRPKKDARRGP